MRKPFVEEAAFSTGSMIDAIRVRLVKRDEQQKTLLCRPVELCEPDGHSCDERSDLTVKYGVSSVNSQFDASVERFMEGERINLVDCLVDREGAVIPSIFVLEPDYLIDASAIAACFQEYSVSPLHYFRSKFEEKENRSYLLLGNLANYFLDELICADNPDHVAFKDVFKRSFKQSPFEYASCEDIRLEDDFRDFMQKAKQQFENIRRVVKDDFPLRGIDVHRCTLEPSFFSEKYGFQGRLDLLQPDSTTEKTRIVELKSGRLPYPPRKSDAIALNHEVQTAVYRLMMKSVSGNSHEVDASILYSAGKRAGENLRAAPERKPLEKKILHLRNLIIANEKELINGNNDSVELMFNALFATVDDGGRLPSFFVKRIETMQKRLAGCDELERSYFYRFIRFVSRELYHQKIGDINREVPTGVASLWNSDFNERVDALDVLFDLSIASIDDKGSDMVIHFSRDLPKEKRDGIPNNSGLVNFREGDICIVYPREDKHDTVLNRQILKGSIVRINPEEAVVRFRYKQKNRSYFEDNRLWAIEHDTLDSSTSNMYKGLFSFLGATKHKRELLLGAAAPKENCGAIDKQLSSQESIIRKAGESRDYFLIVGPPGTGKTSIFARRLIEVYHADPTTNIMVLAYTNRAVDELCNAIHMALGNSDGACDAYIRVGNELSCDPPYRDRLLQRLAEKSDNREALLHEISRTRIFVSTIASINGRTELFNLKHFHVAIIDEASQVLEPQIIGLLPRFDRFVMIGDHNQLATIVLQDQADSKIEEPLLRKVGIVDCRDSLFERLMMQCVEKGWHHAYAQLTQQGRMHEEIAAFPAARFYPEGLSSVSGWQTEGWNLSFPTDHLLHQLVAKERTAFISTEMIHRPVSAPETNPPPTFTKINDTEAEIIAKLMHAIRNVYRENRKPFDTTSVGIIAPYRNQIALIRQKLEQSGLPEAERVMIETVERFQGSQRDIILVSFCVNIPEQMDYLCNLNRDGTVDRKLNVAITRARQQLFLVGNASILREHSIYSRLLEHYGERTIYPVSSSL